ncbi:MAG: nucleotidyltransferase domain-containing protein [Caldilineaceae bacterium]|nr:nucleotidyltransferase domain-containing protein [Caldilineaceae bacterium]
MENVQTLDSGGLLQIHRTTILQLAHRYGASNVRVFGSAARGNATADSDLDLLIDLAPDRSLLDRIALIQDLEDLLGLRVDVVTVDGLHPAMRAEVLRQAISL